MGSIFIMANMTMEERRTGYLGILCLGLLAEIGRKIIDPFILSFIKISKILILFAHIA